MDGNNGPVIPDFGKGDSCVTGDHTFCWGWVHDHWGDTLGPALWQHVELTGIAVAIGFAIAFPLALVAHRFRRFEQPLGTFSALLYTIPSIALFQLLVPFTGITWTTVEIALVAYTLVILFPNIVVGLRSAPGGRDRGGTRHGLDPRRRSCSASSSRSRCPRSSAGLRIAVVSTISIATIAAFLLPKGLGYPIFVALGNPTPFKTEIYSAGGLAVALALACDAGLVILRRTLAPWTRLARA